MQFDQTILDYLRTGSWVSGSAKYPNCPVETEKGKSYVQYDGIRVGNSGDSSGGVSVQFTYRGAAVAWVRLYGARLDTIRHLTPDEIVQGRLLINKD